MTTHPLTRKLPRRAGPTTILLAGLIPVLLLVSCQTDPSSWYPEGVATVAASREVDTEAGRSCQLTLSVENRGGSKISRSTVSLRLSTGAREYFLTLVSETGVLPGGKVFFSGLVAYADPAETLAPDPFSVVSEFYE